MPEALTEERLRVLLTPYTDGLVVPPDLYRQCATYLNLLLRWNAVTNLTAVRDPETLATRQLGESLFAAHLLPNEGTLLDFGSGAGFPGIPLQLLRPGLQVTLAESQGKKASFLHEAVRTLSLTTEVWAGRVEDSPEARRFDVVTMRAVDRSAEMASTAELRVAEGGTLLRFVPGDQVVAASGWSVTADVGIPHTDGRLVSLQRAPVFHVEHPS